MAFAEGVYAVDLERYVVRPDVVIADDVPQTGNDAIS
jgi:hypothetical protein